MNIVGIERRCRKEQVAGSAYIGGPEGSQRNTGDPGIEAHDQLRQRRCRGNLRIHFCGNDAEEGGDEADGKHDQTTDDEAPACGLYVLGAQGNLNDGLQRNVNRNQDDNPRNNGHGTDTGNEIKGRD